MRAEQVTGEVLVRRNFQTQGGGGEPTRGRWGRGTCVKGKGHDLEPINRPALLEKKKKLLCSKATPYKGS
jgi:hypothetical protein